MGTSAGLLVTVQVVGVKVRSALWQAVKEYAELKEQMDRKHGTELPAIGKEVVSPISINVVLA